MKKILFLLLLLVASVSYAQPDGEKIYRPKYGDPKLVYKEHYNSGRINVKTWIVPSELSVGKYARAEFRIDEGHDFPNGIEYYDDDDTEHRQFCKYTGTLAKAGTINAFRAFFEPSTPTAAKAKAISIDSETTDINDIIINDQKLGEQVIYNLNGQRLNNSERGGLYIINGKKMIK